MSVCSIIDDIYSVGVLNPNLRIFDIMMKTEYGTSYNSYIVKGSKKTALIENVHKDFFDEYIDNINAVDVSSIDYIVLNHVEPDHSGSLKKILSIFKNATVVVSKAASIYLKDIVNKEVNMMIVKDNEILDLGDKTLKFIMAPFLHWPDSMFTYCVENQVLFSCDFMGAHYCEPKVFSDKVIYKEKYRKALKHYFLSIFSPFKRYVLEGLGKIENISLNFVCPSHGPILINEDIKYVKLMYNKWSCEVDKSDKTICSIFYASAYGCTELIANEIQKGISFINKEIDVKKYDVNKYEISELSKTINISDVVVVGSPTINRDAVLPVLNLLNCVDAINSKNKLAAAFGSYGWSGEAVSIINDRLKSFNFNVINNGFKVKFVPSVEELLQAFEFGKNIGSCV